MELNCADYADNPELLSSVHFGHVEGAFTGVVKYKRGLWMKQMEAMLAFVIIAILKII